MGGKYINPFTDFGFMRLFGTEMNKELLISFLNSLLHKQEEITDIRYRNTEQLGSDILDRKTVFDVYCQNTAGEYFIVEMQKAEQNFFKDRSVFYATFPIREQALQGSNWDFQLKGVYTVGILDFVFPDDEYAPVIDWSYAPSGLLFSQGFLAGVSLRSTPACGLSGLRPSLQLGLQQCCSIGKQRGRGIGSTGKQGGRGIGNIGGQGGREE